MARELTTYGYAVTQFAIPAGYSLALLVTPAPGEIGGTLKWFSGGSLEIMQAGVTGGGVGITTPIQTAAGQGYLMGTTEIVNTDGAARYYLCASGSTAVAYCLRRVSQGF